MFTISGYIITAQLYESAHSLIYRGWRKTDNLPVVLKVLRNEHPTPKELARFKREYEITRKLDVDGVIKVYALEPYKNTLLMIVEDFGGESLQRLLKSRSLTFAELLVIALAGSSGRIAASLMSRDACGNFRRSGETSPSVSGWRKNWRNTINTCMNLSKNAPPNSPGAIPACNKECSSASG